MNTNESTKPLRSLNTDNEIIETHEWKIEDLLDGVIGHPNGGYYKITPKDIGFVYLTLCNGNEVSASAVCPIVTLLQRVNDCEWKIFGAGDDSWKQNIFSPEELEYKNKVLRAIIFNQLCMEANDLLIGEPDHDKYLKNVLEKANKALIRKAGKNITNLYGAEPEMLINVMNAINNFVVKTATKLPHEFFYLNSIIDEYDEDPTKFIGRKVKLEKLQ